MFKPIDPPKSAFINRRATLLKISLGLFTFLVFDTKLVHARLKRKQNFYKELFESASEAMCLIDYHTKTITDANPFCERLTGYNRPELRGMNTLNLIPKEEHSKLINIYQEVLKRGSVKNITGIHLIKKDGSIASINFSASAIRIDNQEVIQVMIRDISAEERQHRYLKDLETLRNVTLDIASKLEIEELLPKIAEYAVSLASGDGGFVSVVDKDTKNIVHTYQYNLPKIVQEKCTRLTREAINGMKTLTIKDYPSELFAIEEVVRAGVKSVIFVPVLIDEDIRAIIAVYMFSYERAFDTYHRNLLEAVARQASIAIEHAMLHRQLSEALQTSNLLLEAANLIGRTLDVNETLEQLVDIAIRSTGLDHADIGLYDAEHNEMVIAVSYKNVIPAGLRFKLSNLPEAKKFMAGEQLVLDRADPGISPQFKEFMQLTKVQSAFYSPLMYAGIPIGLMCIGSASKRDLGERQIEIARGIASQATAAIQNATLYTKTKTELERERRIAEELQRSLLPQELPRILHTDIGAFYTSSTKEAQVGGDFYDIVALPNGAYAIMIGDVSGKGIEAAAATAMVKYIIRTFLYQHSSPAFALSQANTSLSKQLEIGIFVTVFCAVYEPALGKVTYTNAGHPQPFYFEAEKMSCSRLTSDDPAISLLSNYNYHENIITLLPEDFIVTFTDGTIEARSNGEFYGEDRFAKAIESSHSLLAQGITDTVIDDCLTFSSGKLEDDIAILVIKRV